VSAGRTVAQNHCQSCHTADFGGSTTVPGSGVFARNLTPHAMGLRDWSDQDITRAIRDGRDEDGNELCPAMPRFGNSQINATQLRDLIAFLRSLTPVDRTIPESSCGS
jgi:mono/diheme cytochrome c family protein